MSKEMTAKEALEVIKQRGIEYGDATIGSVFKEECDIVDQALNERDIYYQALCDIESGKDVRMILERVLT